MRPSSIAVFLLLIFLWAPGGSAHAQLTPGDVVVNEILFAPDPASNEFVELLNRSDVSVDLASCTYADANGDFDPIATTSTPLAPGAYVVLVRDPQAFEDAFPDVSFLAPSGWEGLNNGGDTVEVRCNGDTVDAVTYEDTWGGDDGASLERIDPAGPSSASNFGTSRASNGATPGAQNSIFAPDETGPVLVFATERASTEAVATFSEPVDASTISIGTFEVDGVPPTSVDLANDAQVRLTFSQPIDGSTLTARTVADVTGNVTAQTAVPLAYRPSPGAFAVNEILYDPRADDFDAQPNQPEYVEFANLSARWLSLDGLFVTDRPDETGAADTIRAGRRVALAPNGYAVVYADPDAPDDDPSFDPATGSTLARAFPDVDFASAGATGRIALLPVQASSLGLRNDGDRVQVHRADGTVLDGVRYDPDWHADALDDPTGTSLERISSTAAPDDADAWTSSAAPAGGTPGRPNAVSLPPPDDATTGLTISPSPFSIERDGATRIRYVLDDVPSLIRARIFDAVGREVRVLEDAALAGRTGELLWNGRDDDGNRVRVGIYVVLVEAVRAESGTIDRFKRPVVLARPLN